MSERSPYKEFGLSPFLAARGKRRTVRLVGVACKPELRRNFGHVFNLPDDKGGRVWGRKNDLCRLCGQPRFAVEAKTCTGKRKGGGSFFLSRRVHKSATT